METKDLEKFDPTTSELMAMVKATKDITATDLKDKKQMEIVRENRIALKNARVKITKIGKELRENAVDFQKKVIAKEKELIGIIEPEEERLENIEEEAKKLLIREVRVTQLPARKERLDAIEIKKDWATDEEILAMDNEQFESFFNTCVATSNAEKQKAIDEENVRIKKEQDAKQDELDAKEQKLKDEQREVEHQKELKATEERVRAEAEAKAKEDADRKERERIEEEKRIENQKKIDAAKLAKQKEYIDYLKSLGWTKETKEDFKTEETSSGYVIWKKVGEFKK